MIERKPIEYQAMVDFIAHHEAGHIGVMVAYDVPIKNFVFEDAGDRMNAYVTPAAMTPPTYTQLQGWLLSRGASQYSQVISVYTNADWEKEAVGFDFEELDQYLKSFVYGVAEKSYAAENQSIPSKDVWVDAIEKQIMGDAAALLKQPAMREAIPAIALLLQPPPLEIEGHDLTNHVTVILEECTATHGEITMNTEHFDHLMGYTILAT